MTLPEFPAEIRAPTGTTFGVSAYQVQFGPGEVLTPGDEADVLVAFNPAAFVTNIQFLKRGGTVVYDEGTFNERAYVKAGIADNPVDASGTAALPPDPDRDDTAHAGGGRRVRPRPQGRRARQEFLGARPVALALRPVARGDRQVDRAALRQGAGAPRRQPRRAEGRLRLRRDDGAFAPRGRRPEARPRSERPLAHDLRHRCDGARRRRGRGACRAAGLLLLLSDHARLGAASFARQAEGRRQDFSGRGRDRRRLRRDRRVLCRRPRLHRLGRARASR